jgi:hypothetical protein
MTYFSVPGPIVPVNHCVKRNVWGGLHAPYTGWFGLGTGTERAVRSEPAPNPNRSGEGSERARDTTPVVLDSGLHRARVGFLTRALSAPVPR